MSQRDGRRTCRSVMLENSLGSIRNGQDLGEPGWTSGQVMSGSEDLIRFVKKTAIRFRYTKSDLVSNTEPNPRTR
ncbi:hypothetical protein RRG08_055740 [Elysia crispata]|uniref:Uncharacterized protein n=1 Tax=Elysia crispata TaxID=231223 RepID=A0AAE1E7B5_9GAST|nr:hypothetical protein RRG08_055740 [Elysia crispata]